MGDVETWGECAHIKALSDFLLHHYICCAVCKTKDREIFDGSIWVLVDGCSGREGFHFFLEAIVELLEAFEFVFDCEALLLELFHAEEDRCFGGVGFGGV